MKTLFNIFPQDIANIIIENTRDLMFIDVKKELLSKISKCSCRCDNKGLRVHTFRDGCMHDGWIYDDNCLTFEIKIGENACVAASPDYERIFNECLIDFFYYKLCKINDKIFKRTLYE